MKGFAGYYSLGPLVVDMQPILSNETILSAVKTLPKSIQLLKSMAQILTRPEIKALFGKYTRSLLETLDRFKGRMASDRIFECL